MINIINIIYLYYKLYQTIIYLILYLIIFNYNVQVKNKLIK